MCQHLIGKNIKYYGADHVIWGTDCLWWGSPQWVIDAFKRFQISDELCEKFGYKKLTKEDKAKIFGLNAAKIYGVDVARQAQGPARGRVHEAEAGLPRKRRPARQRGLRLGARRCLRANTRGSGRRRALAFSLLFGLAGILLLPQPARWPSRPVTLDPAAWGSDHVGKPVPEYVDGNECLFCHRNDVGPAWSDNRHNRSVRDDRPRFAGPGRAPDDRRS